MKDLTELCLELDPDSWLRWHEALDEVASIGLLDARETAVMQRAREVVASDIAPRAAAHDRSHTFVHDSYQALVRAGLGALLVDPDLGGTGDTHVAYAAAMEEIAAGCGATSLVYMTQFHAMYPLLISGATELARTYVPQLASGAIYGSLGITEPAAGSDVAGLATRAESDGDGYCLTGSKTFITSGDRADLIIAFATVDRALGRRGITAFAIAGEPSGLSRGNPLEKMGMHGSSTVELFFDRVPVANDHVIGQPGGGWQIVMGSVMRTRIGAAAQGVGLARGAYVRTLFALNSIHGRSLPPEVETGLTQVRGRILQARLLLLATARALDLSDSVRTGEVAIMKQQCTDLGWWATVECMRLLGSVGDLTVLGVERCMRDVLVTRTYDGTNDIQALLTGRDTALQVAQAQGAPS
ncbi:acyl-CoA dehydrogenase family protein [Nocardioides endophyticus]|uniref:Acyl-CoA dehydrogenase family protein n=1 Tax=Nocardioides endophyticus TaxID=1353775 RepID=A0ABP8YGC3_9ACTN